MNHFAPNGIKYLKIRNKKPIRTIIGNQKRGSRILDRFSGSFTIQAPLPLYRFKHLRFFFRAVLAKGLF